MVDVNLKGLMYVTKAALPYLLDAAETADRKVADVINLSSLAGRKAVATMAIYKATKFGVTAATESWRQEYTDRNLRFSVIEPGAVDTELFSHQQQHVQESGAAALADIEQLHP